MDSRKSGILCSVRGCHNNWQKRKLFLQEQCFDHRPLLRSECSCGSPYDLHPPPKDDEALRLWLRALNLKKPPKRPYVCSYHFVDKMPTEDHPFPEKWLGYDAPVRRRRRLVRTPTHPKLTDEDNIDVEDSDLCVNATTAKRSRHSVGASSTDGSRLCVKRTNQQAHLPQTHPMQWHRADNQHHSKE